MAKLEKDSYGSVETGDAGSEKPRFRPSTLRVHAGLVVVYACFGGGAFVSKFGIHSANPLLFELLREAFAAPPFLVLARCMGGRLVPDRQDLLRVLATGACFTGSQALFFLGLKHADPTVGTTWQVSLPVFTTLMAVLVGLEEFSFRRGLGTLLACGGAACMTFGDRIFSGRNVLSWSELDGHVIFFCQAILNSAYFVVSKRVATKYGAFPTTGWVFLIGSCFFVALIFAARSSFRLQTWICEDPDPEEVRRCAEAALTFHSSMALPLCYEVLCCSLIAWFLIGWAIQHTKASVVSVYTVVQPCTASVLSMSVIGMWGTAWADHYGIKMPGLHNILGVALILLGLFVMLWWEPGGSAEDTALNAKAGGLADGAKREAKALVMA
mmetsp:Transcript_34660/g.110106  ORF Transcript_34660/g.110106 Transcript_34660/m.110106 type:complete len:383 (+) Transcript_34660:92-1240(+)